jgi:hypothetical protein
MMTPDEEIAALKKELEETKALLPDDGAIRRHTQPLEQALDAAQRRRAADTKALADQVAINKGLNESLKLDKLLRKIRDAAIAADVSSSAINDLCRYGADEFLKSNPTGLTAREFVENQKLVTPFIFKDPNPAPAQAYSAHSPFSREGWNLSAQGQLIKDRGWAAAEAEAAAQGVKIGQTRAAPQAIDPLS